MKIQNLLKRDIESALENIPTLLNYFTNKPSKYKREKVKKGFYGVGVNSGAAVDGAADGGGSE